MACDTVNDGVPLLELKREQDARDGLDVLEATESPRELLVISTPRRQRRHLSAVAIVRLT